MNIMILFTNFVSVSGIYHSLRNNGFHSQLRKPEAQGHNQKKDTHTLDFDVTLTRAYISLIFVREAVRLNSAHGDKHFLRLVP
jgi:hypothetical protein